MKRILILILFIILNTNSFADKKLEKDLKKVSKDNGFINNKGDTYPLENIKNKKNFIIPIENKVYISNIEITNNLILIYANSSISF